MGCDEAASSFAMVVPIAVVVVIPSVVIVVRIVAETAEVIVLRIVAETAIERVGIALTRSVVTHFIRNMIFLACKGATVVTILKASGKFAPSGTRFKRFAFACASTTFTVAICISTWVIGSVPIYVR